MPINPTDKIMAKMITSQSKMASEIKTIRYEIASIDSNLNRLVDILEKMIGDDKDGGEKEA